jgi:ribonuclease R
LFRVHEGPTPEKRQALQNYLKALGLGFTLSDDPKPAELQAISKATQERPDAQQIHTMLLRSMQQAIYTPHNSGHFGLAYSGYTHFTSPIRRYPDLMVHRVIKALLTGKRLAVKNVGAGVERQTMRLGGRGLPPAPEPGAKKPTRSGAAEVPLWEQIGLHCSANERRADEASSDVQAWLKCRYMRERLGEEFMGTVSAVTSFGVFVTLDALYVEGLIHITELGGEYFRFDEVRQELRGERTGLRYVIGTKVKVQVSRVDLDGRRIDFRIVREGDGERLLAKGRSAESASAVQTLAATQQADRQAKRAAKSAKSTQGARAAQAGRGNVARRAATSRKKKG